VKRMTVIWITLLLLTTLSFALGEQRITAAALLFVAALKFVLVAREFMDLRTTSVLWSIGLYSLLAIILCIVLFFV